MPADEDPRAPAKPPYARWLAFAQNALIILLLDKVYDFGRGLIPRNGPVAMEHAHEVWDWEVHHGIFVEPAWQRYWLTKVHILVGLRITPEGVTDFLNTWYLYIHFIGTIAFICWVYFYRPTLFPFIRNVLFLTTAMAMVIYIMWPLAPPRLAPDLLYYNHHYVFIDTIRKVLDPRLQTSQIGYNPYAAMPSLHFGWALIVGGTLCYTLHIWLLRLLAVCYPMMMLATIVISGNHFFADALGSLVVVCMATALVTAFTLWRRRATALQVAPV